MSIYAGANDILRPKIDIDDLLVDYDAGIRKLEATGATVVMFTGFDSRGSKIFGTTRGRTAIYNELVRGIAGDHGALLVDYWRFSEYYDWGMWATTGCTCPPRATQTWPSACSRYWSTTTRSMSRP